MVLLLFLFFFGTRLAGVDLHTYMGTTPLEKKKKKKKKEAQEDSDGGLMCV